MFHQGIFADTACVVTTATRSKALHLMTSIAHQLQLLRDSRPRSDSGAIGNQGGDYGLAQIVAYSEMAVRNNTSVVEYCRTSMAALSGGTAGLLGLTGFYGFGFYLFAVFGLWVSSLNLKSNSLYD
ncbi:hypothetical protein C0J52_18221 [Blattella germanica]|nr:hypothetical protein C0J52_18221 [Blattella germanica]